MKLKLFFIMGPTCAGKSAFLSAVQERYSSVGLVEIGKLLRAKYPPAYFKGQDAPAHTANEAWDLLLAGVAECGKRAVSAVLIDGQPRDLPHVEMVCKTYTRQPELYICRFVHLFASREICEERAARRDAGDPEKLQLSRERMVNDRARLYEVLHMLKLQHNVQVCSFDTANVLYSPLAIFECLLANCPA